MMICIFLPNDLPESSIDTTLVLRFELELVVIYSARAVHQFVLLKYSNVGLACNIIHVPSRYRFPPRHRV